MKKVIYMMVGLILMGFALQSCSDEESYADQKEKERNAIAYFLSRNPLVLVNNSGDTLLNTPGIKVITEEQFEAQDYTTNLDENEYVLFHSTGVYMQIVREGVGEKLEDGDTKRVLCRYWEWNILGDSLQTTDMVPYYATNPEVMNVSNNSGTISATFDTTVNGGGAMYLTYKGTDGTLAVPSGWLAPLTYLKLGRQSTPDGGIAKVRLIVPHSAGHSYATNYVYPCFYEITYQEMRN